MKVMSGKEIMNNFFDTLQNIEGVDLETANILKELYKKGNLTEEAIDSELLKAREGK